MERIEREELGIEKETTANLTSKLSVVPKVILLPHFLENVKQLIKKAKEKKFSEKCIRITKLLKDVIIKKEIDEKADENEH